MMFHNSKKVRNYRRTQYLKQKRARHMAFFRHTRTKPKKDSPWVYPRAAGNKKEMESREGSGGGKVWDKGCWIRQSGGQKVPGKGETPPSPGRGPNGVEEEWVSRAAGLCANSLATAINTSKHQPPKTAVLIVKAGEKPKLRHDQRRAFCPQPPTGSCRMKWESGRHSHSLILSRQDHQRLQNTEIMAELTMPWEEEANEGKAAEYQDLVEECGGRGWKHSTSPYVSAAGDLWDTSPPGQHSSGQVQGPSIPQWGCRKSHSKGWAVAGVCTPHFRANAREKGSLWAFCHLLLLPPRGGGVGLQPGRSEKGAESLSRSQAKKPSHTALLLISQLFSPNFVQRDTIKAFSCT